MERTLTDEEKKAILNFGAFGYEPERMASILGWGIDEVKAGLSGGEFSELVQRGKDMGEYAIDSKLWDMALSGDMKAMERFEERKLARKLRKK